MQWDTKLVGTFDTKGCVESSVTDMTVAKQIARSLSLGDAVIVHGESGSGKTNAMLFAGIVLKTCLGDRAMPRTEVPLTPFAIYTSSDTFVQDFEKIQDLCDSRDSEYVSPNENDRCQMLNEKHHRVHPRRGDSVVWENTCKCKTCARDFLSAQLLLRLIDREIKMPRQPEPQPYHAVVVVDEIGSYPGFVRAVCALGEPFRANLAKHLSIARVSIVMGGTGSEIANLSPRSPRDSFTVIHVATNLWPALVASNRKLAPFAALMAPPALGLADVRSVTAKLAHDLSSNARAAALLARELQCVATPLPAKNASWNCSVLLGTATVRAALEYKKMSALRDPTPEDHCLLVVSALAASHFLPCKT